MKFKNIAEILERAENKDIVSEVHGTVCGVWPPKSELNKFSGENEKKQFCLIEDGSGKIGVQLIDKDDVAEGEMLSIYSVSTKHGLKGIAMNRYIAKDNTEKTLLKITGVGNIQKNGKDPAPSSSGGGARKKADYTAAELLELFEWWLARVKDPGAASKMVGCSMVIGHKAQESPDLVDEGAEKPGADDHQPSFDSDEDIPF